MDTLTHRFVNVGHSLQKKKKKKMHFLPCTKFYEISRSFLTTQIHIEFHIKKPIPQNLSNE